MLKMTLSELGLPNRFMIKIKKDLEQLLNYEAIQIEKIILFGSCARGTCKITSDLDLLVVTHDVVSRSVRGDLASELDEPLDGVRTDIVFYNKQVFEEADSLFMRQIRQDGIIIYDCQES
ncbi:MAG: nucleotidyltransferase domain-containing protein [Cellulosilyticaceae bacterium]